MRRALSLTALLLLGLGCSYTDPGQASGTMIVTTTTIGGTPDPNGYTVAVTGQAGRPIGVNDTTFYPGLEIGTYTVTLGDVAGGCTVTDGAERSVYQTVGNKNVIYQINCP